MPWPWWPCPKTGTTYSTYNPNFDWIRLLWFNQGLPMSFLKAARPNFVISSFGSSFTRKIRRKQNTNPQKHEILPDSKTETKNMWFWLKPRYTSAMPTQLILPNTQMFFSPAPVPWRPPFVVLGCSGLWKSDWQSNFQSQGATDVLGIFKSMLKKPVGTSHEYRIICITVASTQKTDKSDKSFSTIVGFDFSFF
jgi:hypothetical protein